jgi:hypothetical protein
MLKRVLLVCSLSAALLALSGAVANAAPSNAKNAMVVEADCGNAGPVNILVNGGGTGFDVTVQNGRVYELVSLQGRGYEGSLTTEPPPPPAFVFQHDYGNRNGFSGDTFNCTASFQQDFNGTTFTTFLNFVATTK